MGSALIAYITLTWLAYYRFYHFVITYQRTPSLAEVISSRLPINTQVQATVLIIGGFCLAFFIYQLVSGSLSQPRFSDLFSFAAWSLLMAMALWRAFKTLSPKSTA